MRHPLRFAVGLLPNPSWDVLEQRCQHIEELGFDLVATGDHFVDWSNPAAPWFEAWTALAAMARATTRIRLAIYVSQIPLRNPAMLARQVLTVDHVSNGRVEVGLGTGVPFDPACDMIGLPNWTAKERVARFPEYVEIVDQLLSNEVTTYERVYYSVTDAVMNPRPIQQPRPPIVIAAMGPAMLKLAARYADNWNSVTHSDTFDQQLAETAERIKLLNEACAAIDRDPATLRRSYLMLDPSARRSGGRIVYYESEQAFIDMASRVIELGISEIDVYYPFLEEQVPMFERIALNVLPKLKA